MHGEAENVMEDLRTSLWRKHFELDIFAMPTFDKFRDLIRNCTSQNVVLVCFSGHAGEGGECQGQRHDGDAQARLCRTSYRRCK